MENDARGSQGQARRFLHVFALLFFIGGIAFYFGGPILFGKGKIAGCRAGHYSTDVYLAYCASPGYGDVEHGLMYFDMDPVVHDAVTRAELVVLGNSITQFAFSTEAARQTLSAKMLPYYLLGFAYFETIDFARILTTRLKLRPRIAIINADEYFWSSKISAPAQTLLSGSPSSRMIYSEKLAWQSLHSAICGSSFGHKLKFCGDTLTIFRARNDGSWVGLEDWNLPSQPLHPSAQAAPVSEAENRGRAAKAAALIKSLEIPSHCLVVTNVPNEKTAPDEGRRLAELAGATYIAPAINGVRTIDGIHLEQDTAERWSREFLTQLLAKVGDCFTQTR